MPEYTYNAWSDDASAVVRGTLESENEQSLKNALAGDGQRLLYLTTKWSFPKRTWKPKRRAMIEFFTLLHAQYNAGIPLIDALAGMAEESEKNMKVVLTDVVKDIRAGSRLYESLASHNLIDTMGENVLRAGDESGTLDEALKSMIHHLSWAAELTGTIKQVSIYPTALMVVVLLFIGLVFGLVVPKIAGLLTKMGTSVPLPTKILMSVSQIFQSYGLPILILLIVATVIAIPLSKKHPVIRNTFDRFLLKMPIFGEVFAMIAISRITHTLSALLKAGMLIDQSFRIAAGAAGNYVYRHATITAIHSIAAGDGIAVSLAATKVFPPMVLRMIGAGEESGKIDEALAYVTSYYDEEVPRRVKLAIGMMEPVVIIILGVVVGFVAMALILPLMSILDSVHV